jgi:plasmid stabilization system protein ParE
MPDVEMPDRGTGAEDGVPEGGAPRVQLRITDSFIEDAARIYSPRVARRIRDTLEMIQNNPDIGSPLARESLVKAYGPNIRTFAISSFVLVYRHSDEYVDILALVYGATIR